VRENGARLAAVRAAQDDLASAGSVAQMVLEEGEPAVHVTLAATG